MEEFDGNVGTVKQVKKKISTKATGVKKSKVGPKNKDAPVQELNEYEVRCVWDPVDVLADKLDLANWAVKNTVKLLDEDNTVPFIARYRKEQTNNMEADKIRDLKENYEELKTVQNKVASVMKSIAALGKLTMELKSSLRCSQNMSEVEHLYAPFKAGSKRTLAERARELGLEPLTMQVLKNPMQANLNAAVNPDKEGLKNMDEVKEGVQHIIADMLSKDKDVMDMVRQLCGNSYVTLESTKSRVATKASKPADKEKKNANVKKTAAAKPQPTVKHQEDINKFELYFNFSCPVRHIKPHQVLAINRGESLKVLTVKVNIPDKVKIQLNQFCFPRWCRQDANGLIRKLIGDSIEDAYKRLIEPLMSRHIRADLTKKAEKASIEVFASNLKRLLLTPPVRGEVVLGVDPGFRNGCKYAVTSNTGKILSTGVAYLHNKGGGRPRDEFDKIREAVMKHRAETVAIGNGTACRETETCFSDLIQMRAFEPLQVKYCIVSESGASIYSASDVAKKEMPDLDVNLRSAVSIARRLQDPLAELVKIEPKHIGVGMYQHDMPETQLKTALDGVVEDCVSFVGVDINVCSEMLLRRVAGMNGARAKKVLEWRDAHGAFKNRLQLKAVKGLGPKTFEQCAGFVRVLPETRDTGSSEGKMDCDPLEAGPSSGIGEKRKSSTAAKAGKSKKAKLSSKTDQPNNLDCTSIHPESYAVAERFMQKADLSDEEIGQPSAIRKVQAFMKNTNMKSLAGDLGVGEPTMQLIVNGLSQPIGHDIREEFQKPLFKQGLTSMQDLKVGTVLTGRVSNTTHFGAFVDIGVGRDGLVHVSKMPRHLLNGKSGLELGDRIEVRVDSIDRDRGRIGLLLVRLLG